jgi:hypothetical protein
MFFSAVEAEDSVEKEVSVAINDKESRVIFIDHQHGGMSVRSSKRTIPRKSLCHYHFK